MSLLLCALQRIISESFCLLCVTRLCMWLKRNTHKHIVDFVVGYHVTWLVDVVVVVTSDFIISVIVVVCSAIATVVVCCYYY